MTNTSFAALGVPPVLVDALKGMDRETPFPIQSDTLPDTLAGRDVLGRGKTGSGKTLAFAIPMVAALAGRRGRNPRGLVLAPTRELATQITATFEPLAKAVGLSVTTIFGGVPQGRQETALRRGADIVVACPGRLDDLMKQGIARLDEIEVTVLDEADHMADLGFLPVVTRILDKTPRKGQRMLFSATLDNGVDKLVKKYLADPVKHSVDDENSPVAQMTHHVFEVSDADKPQLVKALASGMGRRILFTRTKHQAKKLAKQLTASGVPAVDLHGNLSQNARDRNLAAFSDGSVKVLVATDVAARGVHVDNVELVVHVDPPVEHKAYLHRSGRTARAGSAGDVATVMLPSQRSDTAAILRRAKIDVRAQRVTADAAPIKSLVGQYAPHVAPALGGPGVGNEPRQPQPAGRPRSGRPSSGSRQPTSQSQGARSGGGSRQGGMAGFSSSRRSTGGGRGRSRVA
ncbi:DEAD/DEAH box helicase [Tessaracoccus sp. SD287]|uniref:DEAD/DEAH box helicase n=1 Tax=Tessaracoccus sp. SD287 TaxID=2782008 RepID=UPI001A956508|nr:DEAD/DEAH box helicase [Tessaracoccus sp. SD287]MBO1031981.1 DEAD/DEAH box helicase [Tessaracoccus sp. SD287]